jgi:hypothetical protein
MIQQPKSNPQLLDEQIFSERIASAISAIGTSRHFAAPRSLVAFGGTTDMAGLAAGSTRSRMTLNRPPPVTLLQGESSA